MEENPVHPNESKHDRVTRQWLEVMPKGWGTFGDKGMHKGERRMLIERVDDDEDILALVGGTFRQDTDRLHKHNGVAVATSQRVIFLDKGVFGSEEVMEIGYRQIESITYSSGLLMGGIEIKGIGTASYRIEDIKPKGSNKAFADCVRQQIDQLRRQDLTPQRGDTRSDVSAADELQKLAALLQDGHITAEEFEALKQQVLQKDSASDSSAPPANTADDRGEMTPPEPQSSRLPPQNQPPQQTDDKNEMKPLQVLGGCLVLIIAAILIGGVCMVVFSNSDEDTTETSPTATTRPDPTRDASATDTNRTLGAVLTATARPRSTPDVYEEFMNALNAQADCQRLFDIRNSADPQDSIKESMNIELRAVGCYSSSATRNDFTSESTAQTDTAIITSTPTPISLPTGLGISSQAIVDRFSEVGDYDVERDGSVASIYSYDGSFQVGLFGPQHDITEASAIVRVNDDSETTLLENSLLLVVLMNEITSWDPNEALVWLRDSMEQLVSDTSQVITKSHDGYLFELTLLILPSRALLSLDITR